MIKTALLLIVALIVLPFVAIKIDSPLTPLQCEMILHTVYFMLVVAIFCFTASEITKNYSQVDKLWSILPIIYTLYFAYASQWNPRLVIMAALAMLWGVRLTYNFARKGAYSWRFWSGEEDYRWKVLRETPPLKGKWRWTLFNFFFISLYQNAIILLFTLPAVAAAAASREIGLTDYALALFFLLFLIIETIADQQMWNFQQEKKRRKISGEVNDEFINSGLWSKVRHPNYTSEQAMWIVFYFFSVAATGRWINWSMAGCVLLLLLFQGSADFSEKISASKYHSYKDYQKLVPRFLPRWW